MTTSESPMQARASEKIKLLVATPCFGGLAHVQYIRGLLDLQRLALENDIDLCVTMPRNESLITRGRNLYVHEFLKGDYTHLLSIDADIIFDARLVLALLATDLDFVCVPYPRKGIDWKLVSAACRRHEDYPEGFAASYAINPIHEHADETESKDGRLSWTFKAQNGCIPIRDAATGFLLTKREAILKLCYAYPETVHIADIGVLKGEAMFALFDCGIEPETRRYLSEDYLLSRRWQKIGGTVWAYLGPFCALGHIGSYEYRGDPYAQFVPVGDGRRGMATEHGLPEEVPVVHQAYMLERYHWAAKHLAGARHVADACCGPGYGMPILRSTASNVTGYDRDKDNCRIATERKYGAVQQTDDVQTETLAAHDALCSLETIEHLPDPIGWLRALSPSVTRMVLSAPCIPTMYRNKYHLHDFTYDEVRNIVQAMGWNVKAHECQAEDTILLYAERTAA